MEENSILHTGLDIECIRKMADDAGSDIVALSLAEHIPGLPVAIPALLDRANGRIVSVRDEFEKYRTYPPRKFGTAQVETLASFIDLVNRHKTPDSALFASFDWQKPGFTAVIDYHENESAGAADNGKHRIHYPFPLSEEWKAWTGSNAAPMDQASFAEFIEDRIPDLAAPDEAEAEHWRGLLGGRVATPADIITLSRGLKVFSETKVGNSITLSSGEGQITFEEEHKDAAGNKLNVPSLFIIRVAPFFRGEAIRLPVRLRYRVKAGSITWAYQLYKPEKFITEEVEGAFSRVTGATDLPGFIGKPEMSA
jgi:uncharacterized protein YfdQ (DUF2303 family)